MSLCPNLIFLLQMSTPHDFWMTEEERWEVTELLAYHAYRADGQVDGWSKSYQHDRKAVKWEVMNSKR